MGESHRLSLQRIQEAARVIDPLFLDTPQFLCEPLGDPLGVRVVLKVETVNPIRSFKGRGADLLVAAVPPGARLICASAGNFGQAMAYACRKRGVDLTVYSATTANTHKVARMRALGARVILHGDDFDAAKLEAKQVARETGVRLVEDSLDVETVEGAGTIGLELLDLPEPLDDLLVPVGNGALFSGIARVVKACHPATRMIAVQAAGAPAMIESWRAGRVVERESVHTIADGIAIRIPVPEAAADMRGLVDDALLVQDETIVTAMRLLLRHAGLVAEPSAAAGLAALLENRRVFHERTVGTIICGGNLTDEQARAWLWEP